MINEIDVRGLNAVSSLIKQTGYSYFVIYRPSNGTKIPVFEYQPTTAAGNIKAVKAFEQWAETVGVNSCIYEILIFQDLRTRSDADGNVEVLGKSTGTNGKMRFTFVLQDISTVARDSGSSSPNPVNIQEIVQNAIQADRQTQLLEKLVDQFEDIQDRLEDLEESKSGGLAEYLPLLMQLKGNQPAALADQVADSAPVNADLVELREALRILKRNDPKYIPHLGKLAQISEDQPGLFRTLITTLEGM